ncbi:MAG: anti-sigma factor antagonist [Planctomycetaceae bacterium]|nr:anti-sigma factor antagonist [Planctomycetaceae bacterium]
MSNTFFSVERLPGGILVHLTPEIDPLNFQECIETVEEMVEGEPQTSVCLDLSDLRFIQSAALSLLMRLNQRVKDQGGQLALMGLQPQCLNVVRVTRLDSILTLLESDKELQDFWSGERPSVLAPLPEIEELVPPRVVNRDAIENEIVPWGQIYWLAKPEHTGCKNIRMSHGLIRAGAEHAFHRHPATDEMLYILSGRLTIWIKDERQQLRAGSVVFLPKDTIHALHNPSDSHVEFLSIYSPGMTSDLTIDMSEQEPWKSFHKQREAP